ncbi:hypothetical protein MHP7448_0298 [Mesomycoplasma hyopneumoniae 7448]|uniref:Uncharacterized protein n=1 Tax=Mesomycoplasma hyopneumoniae (strain 7448) TaxID=262722 RepID=Q4A868_MESH7|nr:hypothetical protein [Mesomycoplasma hyopneumoniae]AAZ53671.2 hypothetical protein MHP7448_0298 [Mesomycoplasma hyopneumoniae 7448]AGQ50927.1 hypothetical protein MHL_2845 [Mesomycoplasma hyopneumoniae 7422]
MKYSFIKSNKFKIFSSGLMLTTLASPLLFTSIAPLQQKQIAPEIKIQSNEFSSTEILKNNVIKYVFENDKKNIDSIKFELNKLVKLNKLNDLSEKDLNKFAENLISFTKDHFKDKEVLEEAWYHWFPMAFWYGLYGVATVFDVTLNFLGALFNQLPTILDAVEIYSNIATGNYEAGMVNNLVLTTKILNSMYMNEKNIISNSINDASLDSLANFINNSDVRSAIVKLLKNSIINLAFNPINQLVQEGIRRLSAYISFDKVKIWANYIYYYNLYWGVNREN